MQCIFLYFAREKFFCTIKSKLVLNEINYYKLNNTCNIQHRKEMEKIRRKEYVGSKIKNIKISESSGRFLAQNKQIFRSQYIIALSESGYL